MSETLRVLLVSPRYPPAVGGVESHVAGLARTLVDLGHVVTVYTTDIESFKPPRRVPISPPNEADRVKVVRTHAISIDPGRSAILAISPRQIVLPPGLDPDVVHVHSFGFFSSTLPAMSPFYSAFPMVLTAHSTPDSPLPRWIFDRTLGGRILRRMSCIIALTHLEEKFLRSFIGSETELCVIPNGLGIGELRRLATLAWRSQSAPTNPYVLYAGRLAANKGLDVLLRAFGLIAPAYPEYHLRFVGPDFGVRSKLVDLASRLGILSKVEFLGEVDRESYVGSLSRAACLVLPSTFGESQGIVLLEALALGTPVIGTRVGGIPETLADGRLGLVVKPGDSQELAEAVRRVVAARHGGVCTPCETTELSKYDWARVGGEVALSYRRALDKFNS
ncbi:MAG: glycosyltransferase family 4 protein [Thermoplasmata archaeon]